MGKTKLISFVGDDGNKEGVYAQIRDVCGHDVADKLSRRCGGQRLSIPSFSDFDEQHAFAVNVGYDLARTIVVAVATKQPSGWFDVPMSLDRQIQALLQENGVSSREIAQRTGVHMRTVFRHKQRMLSRGLRVGDPFAPRTLVPTPEESKGQKIVRDLLLEGHSPSQIRDILRVPGQVVLSIRAELLREGKL